MSKQPTVVFGMNTMFAVRHFLPEILAMARDRGFRVVVVAPPDPGGDAGKTAWAIPGVEVRQIPMMREISPLSDLVALWRMWRMYRALRPSVCNVSTPKMGLIGGVAAWLARVPHRIYTLRGIRYETTRGWKRRLLMACEWIACQCAHQVICISQSVKEIAIRQGIAEEGKAILLGTKASEGISLRGRDIRPMKQIVPAGKRVIGFVGRLTREKGISELIEAFQILRRDGLNVCLLLLGDFEAGDPVDWATVESIRTDSNIRWLGYVPDPRPYFHWMDVVALPTYREGLSMVLLEAAAAGKAVVSTHTTGVVDVVIDGITGLLVSPRNAPALADAIRRLIEDDELASRMGREARRLVEAEFDNTIYLKRLSALLEAGPGDRRVRNHTFA